MTIFSSRHLMDWIFFFFLLRITQDVFGRILLASCYAILSFSLKSEIGPPSMIILFHQQILFWIRIILFYCSRIVLFCSRIVLFWTIIPLETAESEPQYMVNPWCLEMFNFFTSVHNHSREFLRRNSEKFWEELKNLQQTSTAKMASDHKNECMVYWEQQALLSLAW